MDVTFEGLPLTSVAPTLRPSRPSHPCVQVLTVPPPGQELLGRHWPGHWAHPGPGPQGTLSRLHRPAAKEGRTDGRTDTGRVVGLSALHPPQDSSSPER